MKETRMATSVVVNKELTSNSEYVTEYNYAYRV